LNVLDYLSDLAMGPCIRRLNSNQKAIYLTFDDGPKAPDTYKILELLDHHDLKATFFVVANQCKKNPQMLREIIAEGHSIGDHSWDHRYSHFFQNGKSMRTWIEHSYGYLSDFLGHQPVGFRSPAGIRTPILHAVLQDLNIPLIHWSCRFFDTVHSFSFSSEQRKLERIQPGEILLLHDVQPTDHLGSFLENTGLMISFLKNRGFNFSSISKKELPKSAPMNQIFYALHRSR
jgi:peptidoglycan-N-acetylglucosamine deacetylase